MTCTYEQRNAQRKVVNWPVSVWHPQAERFFNGRSANISSGGTLLLLPMKAPIREGQEIEINFPHDDNLDLQDDKETYVKKARVVRVDRAEAVHSATIKVGLEFDTKASCLCSLAKI